MHDNRLLLLQKSILVFESRNQEEALTRVEHLAKRANNDDDEAAYLHTEDLRVMYMKNGNYGCAVPLNKHAISLVPNDEQ